MSDQLPLCEIELDDQLAARLRASADARVRARIDAAQQTAQQRTQSRTEFAQARRKGLQARRAARTRRQPSQHHQANTRPAEGTAGQETGSPATTPTTSATQPGQQT